MLNFQITKGNTDDRMPLENESLLKNIFSIYLGTKDIFRKS